MAHKAPYANDATLRDGVDPPGSRLGANSARAADVHLALKACAQAGRRGVPLDVGRHDGPRPQAFRLRLLLRRLSTPDLAAGHRTS